MLHYKSYLEGLRERELALDRYQAIKDGLGEELVAKFERESLQRGGEQFLPNKDKINCMSTHLSFRTALLFAVFLTVPTMKESVQKARAVEVDEALPTNESGHPVSPATFMDNALRLEALQYVCFDRLLRKHRLIVTTGLSFASVSRKELQRTLKPSHPSQPSKAD